MESFGCPGCGDEVYVEELVEGRCPLCGEVCGPSRPGEYGSSPYASDVGRWLIARKAADGLVEYGVRSPGAADEVARSLLDTLDPYTLGEDFAVRRFRWKCGAGIRDYLRPKSCTFCRERHFLVGAKLLDGVMEIDPAEGEVDIDAEVHWVCRSCLTRTPRSALGEGSLPPL